MVLLVGCLGEPNSAAPNLPAAIVSVDQGGVPDLLVTVTKTPDEGQAVESTVPLLRGQESVWAQSGIRMELRLDAHGQVSVRLTDEAGVQTAALNSSEGVMLNAVGSQIRVSAAPPSMARLRPNNCSCGSPSGCQNCCIKSPVCCECCGTGCTNCGCGDP